MRLPSRHQPPRSPAKFHVAAEDAARLAEEASAVVERAIDSGWYRDRGGDADRAAFALCRLRRAGAGEGGRPEAGDEAVRAVLQGASAEAVVWLASRAISYMDETGFPEAVEPDVAGQD